MMGKNTCQDQKQKHGDGDCTRSPCGKNGDKKILAKIRNKSMEVQDLLVAKMGTKWYWATPFKSIQPLCKILEKCTKVGV